MLFEKKDRATLTYYKARYEVSIRPNNPYIKTLEHVVKEGPSDELLFGVTTFNSGITYQDGVAMYQPFVLNNTPIYVMKYTIDSADPHGNISFHYHEKTILTFSYYEMERYLTKIETQENGTRLYVEYASRNLDLRYTETYDISNPAEPKILHKTEDAY